MRRHPYRTAAISAIALASMTLTGCGGSAGVGDGPSTAATTTVVAKQSRLADLLPKAIRARGAIKINTDPTYPPDEFLDANGNITGWNIDLFNAVAERLGLKTEYINAAFDLAIPGIKNGTYDVGVSSFTDTKQREESVDFVDYFKTGTQWSGPKGKVVDPNNACGLRVAVQISTKQLLQDLPAKSAACKTAGKPAIRVQQYNTLSACASAVILGKADAMLGNFMVMTYAVTHNPKTLQLEGPVYGGAPMGWPVKKGSPLAHALERALESVMADGTYNRILKKWHVQSGAIATPTTNGAVS